jgi:D-lactate dehydrogenase (cytochrome)
MLIKCDKDIIKGYFEDYSGLLGGHANEVAFPENEKDIFNILENASLKNTPITVSGGGTGVTGGRIPFGGTVLTTEFLNKIIAIDTKNRTAILQPAVKLSDLDKELKEKNLIYLPEPTEANAFIGGTVSTNASGAKGFKYGSTRKFVHRLKIMLPSGDIINIKRGDYIVKKGSEFPLKLKDKEINIKIPDYTTPNIKTAAGYYIKDTFDLIDLFIGHEGTLGIILEIEICLGIRPENIVSFFGFFPSDEAALNFVKEAKNHNALSIEYMDPHSIELIRKKYPHIPKNIHSLIYFENETTKENESGIIDLWMSLLEKHNAYMTETYFADNDKERQKLLELRHALPDSVNEIIRKNKFPKVGTDIAVPDDKFPEMFKFYKEKLIDSNIDYVIFGHIGESHMHVNLLPKNEADFIKSRAVYMDFVKKAVSLGGTISAEHGIGKLKHKFLEVMYGKENIKQMAVLKKSLDPMCLLGMDNIFPKELLD